MLYNKITTMIRQGAGDAHARDVFLILSGLAHLAGDDFDVDFAGKARDRVAGAESVDDG
jgi:hypothetical protein